MKYLFLKVLPKNLVSRAMGHLADWNAPKPLLHGVIRQYAQHYQINLDEMKLDLDDIENFNQFFTRELKPGLRPIDPGAEVAVSPVDGKIAEHGRITDGLLVQTKGIYYSLTDLVGEKDAERYLDGYFMTLYLSPADYHRIHTPFKGRVEDFSYFSGNLWPVNQFGVEEIGGLFAINERIVTNLLTDFGPIGMVKVGATVVGKIKTTYSNVVSNQGQPSRLNLPVQPARFFEKGQELGRFQLGSTVILLFAKGSFQPDEFAENQTIKMGERLGTLVKPG